MFILINSHIRNIEAQRVLLESIPATLHSRTVVAVGGCNSTERLFQQGGVWYLQVQHNSIDFTGLVAVLEHRDLLQHALGPSIAGAFTLHDTMSFGKRTAEILANMSLEELNSTRALTGSARSDKYQSSMNMGFYTLDALDSVARELLHWRGPTDGNPLAELAAKKHQIGTEGSLFLSISNTCNGTCIASSFCRHAITLPNYTFQYDGSKHIRRVLYFPELDLYKYKANFQWIPRKYPNYAMVP